MMKPFKKTLLFLILGIVALFALWEWYKEYNADYFEYKKMEREATPTKRQIAEHLKLDRNPCSNFDDSLTMNLISRSKNEDIRSIGPIKFEIPKPYLVGTHNRKGGDREFISIDAELEDLSPRCHRYRKSKEESKPSSQTDKKSFDVKLTIGNKIDPTFSKEKVYTQFVTTDKYGYDLYRKNLKEHGDKTYFFTPQASYTGLTKYLICKPAVTTIRPRENFYKDELDRTICRGWFNYRNQLNVEYRFFHEHLDELEMLEQKAIRLIEKFKVN